MAAKTEELIQEIVSLHKVNKFEKILESLYDVILSEDQARKTILRTILWPVPTQWDLEVLSGFISSREISNIFSIGCGTGLLEWLLLQAATFSQTAKLDCSEDGHNDFMVEVQRKDENKTDLSILPIPVTLTAVEVDSQWWSSKYAPPTFLPLLYADEDFSTKSPFGSRKDLALFSYFNNMKAFKNYLSLFQGSYVVIIGPTQKQYCAPSPLDLKNHPDLPTTEWNIILFQRFGLEAVDYIAVYSKAQDFYF